MSEPVDSAQTGMRRMGTSDPDGDTLTFTLDESTGTVYVEGALKTDAALTTTSTNPGKRIEGRALLNLLRDLHVDMTKHQKHCNVKIEFSFTDGRQHKNIVWTCIARVLHNANPTRDYKA